MQDHAGQLYFTLLRWLKQAPYLLDHDCAFKLQGTWGTLAKHEGLSAFTSSLALACSDVARNLNSAYSEGILSNCLPMNPSFLEALWLVFSLGMRSQPPFPAIGPLVASLRMHMVGPLQPPLRCPRDPGNAGAVRRGACHRCHRSPGLPRYTRYQIKEIATYSNI